MKVLNVLFLAIISHIACAQQAIEVPKTKISDILITDGYFTSEEWKDATIISISKKDSVFLYLKNYNDHILLGIKTPFKMVPYIDMFVDFGKGYIHHLHSSAQIGERILTDTTWTDTNPPTRWGNANAWYANEMRTDRVKAQELVTQNPNRDRTLMLLETTYPIDGYEYIFHKKRFSDKEWKVRIEVRTGMPGLSSVIYPADSKRKDSNGWARIHFK